MYIVVLCLCMCSSGINYVLGLGLKQRISEAADGKGGNRVARRAGCSRRRQAGSKHQEKNVQGPSLKARARA